MENSKEIKQALWSSKIAVRCELSMEMNVQDNSVPHPLYMFIYCQHYPMFYLETIYEVHNALHNLAFQTMDQSSN